MFSQVLSLSTFILVLKRNNTYVSSSFTSCNSLHLLSRSYYFWLLSVSWNVYPPVTTGMVLGEGTLTFPLFVFTSYSLLILPFLLSSNNHLSGQEGFQHDPSSHQRSPLCRHSFSIKKFKFLYLVEIVLMTSDFLFPLLPNSISFPELLVTVSSLSFYTPSRVSLD